MRNAIAILIIAAGLLVPSTLAEIGNTSTSVVETIKLAWTPAPPDDQVTSYRLFFSRDPELWTHAKDVAGGATAETLLPITEPGTWFFTIAARNASGVVGDLAPVISYTVTVGPGVVGAFRITGTIRTTNIHTSETLILVP
jgi:hypothetical protein